MTAPTPSVDRCEHGRELSSCPYLHSTTPSVEAALRELLWVAKDAHGWLIQFCDDDGLVHRYDVATDRAEASLAARQAPEPAPPLPAWAAGLDELLRRLYNDMPLLPEPRYSQDVAFIAHCFTKWRDKACGHQAPEPAPQERQHYGKCVTTPNRLPWCWSHNRWIGECINELNESPRPDTAVEALKCHCCQGGCTPGCECWDMAQPEETP